MPDVAELERRARALVLGTLNDGRVELVDELLHPAFRAWSPPSPEALDRDAFRAAVAAMAASLGDGERIVVEDCFGAGDRVVVRWTLATAEPVAGITIFRFEDGLVLERWVTTSRAG